MILTRVVVYEYQVVHLYTERITSHEFDGKINVQIPDIMLTEFYIDCLMHYNEARESGEV